MIERVDYEELEMRVRQNKKYEKGFYLLSQFGILFILAFPIADTFFSGFFGRTPSSIELWVILIVPIVLTVLGGYKSAKGLKKYSVRQDEWALFYCENALRWLNRNAPNKELGKEYRRNAVKSIEGLISVIVKKWGIGSFYLFQRYFTPISELKENLRHKILPILKGESDKEVAVVKQIMQNFLVCLMNLSIEGIIKTNEEISLKIKEVQELGGHHSFSEQITELTNTHRLIANMFFVTVVTVGCIFFFYLMTTYVGIVKEYVFGGTVVIFIGLLTIYFAKRGRG